MSSHSFQAAYVNVPSELYKHLHQNYGSFRPESFIRALWIKQMPPEVQLILAAFHDKGIDEVTAVADSVMRVIETNRKKNEIAYRDLLLMQRFDMLSEKVEKLASDVRRLLKWKEAKENDLGVGELQSNDVVMPPVPETWRIRSPKYKSVVNTKPEQWLIRSKIRVRSASPTSRLKMRGLASVNTYNVQI